MVEVVYLTAAETEQLVSHESALAAAEQVFRWHASGEIAWPEPNMFSLRLKSFSSAYRIKGCCLTAVPVVGIRVTGYHLDAHGGGSSAPDNTRYIILSDPNTGFPLAVVDEHWTYNLRTCASAVASIRQLARPESAVVGLIGAGALATTSLEMLASLFPLKSVRVTSRRAETREGFAARMTERTGVKVEPVASPEEGVRGADIVLCATSAEKTMVFDGWLAESAVLCTLGRYEVDAPVYRSVDKVVVDDWQVAQESPDVKALLRDGAFSAEEVYADMAAILSGAKPGRTSPSERILIRSDGLVTQDVAIVYSAYREALAQGIGARMRVG